MERLQRELDMINEEAEEKRKEVEEKQKQLKWKYGESSPRWTFHSISLSLTLFREWIIARINSSSYLIKVNFSQTDAYLVTIDRDILRNIELSGQRANTIVTVKSDALMAALTRREEDCRQGNQENQFIFVIAWSIDWSGSTKDVNNVGFTRQAML